MLQTTDRQTDRQTDGQTTEDRRRGDNIIIANVIFSERELMFMFAICRRPSVCRLSVVCRLSSVTFVHPAQAIEIFGNVFTPFGTFTICDPSVKILWRSSQGNPSVGGLNQRGVEKYSDFGPFQGYISETVQDRR